MTGNKPAVSLEKCDGTDLPTAPRKRHEYEFRYSLVTESEKLGWFDYRPHTGEFFLDRRGRELWGLGSDDKVDIDVLWTGVHPEDLLKARAAIESVFNSDRSDRLEIECRLRPLDGSRERWVHVTGRLFSNGDQNSVQSGHLVGVVQDITERKLLEREHMKMEAKFRDIVKYAPLGMYELDFQGPRFRSVNDLMCQYLGYTREELMSMNPLQLLDNKCSSMAMERIRKRLVGETIDNSLEIKVTAKDGRVYYVILYIILTYSDGKPDGAS
jgi:PAS domain S-box-containing protein